MHAAPRLAWLLPGLLLFASAAVRAADPPKPEERVAVAKLTSEPGSLMRREAADKPWKPILSKEELFTGDLIVGGFDAALESLNGHLGVSVQGDLCDDAPFPVLETAIVLHQSKDVDLDFTLDRGRVTMTNLKKEGTASVRIRVRGHSGMLTLDHPGDKISMEIFGRWLPGVPFKKDTMDKDGPSLALVLLIIKGEGEIKVGKNTMMMKEPPGPALYITHDIEDPIGEPRHLDKLPQWCGEGHHVSERTKQVREILAKFRKQVLTRPPGDILDEMVLSENPIERETAVFMMGSFDDLPRLATALSTTKFADVWDSGVVELRHWIGRGPGQDMILYQRLIDQRGYTPVQAEMVLDLLHSFGEEDLAKAETYEQLIDYLESDKLAVRGLANWHLVRLVPQGKAFGYDPLAPKEKRDEAVQQWRKLIPAGKLPPKPKLDGK